MISAVVCVPRGAATARPRTVVDAEPAEVDQLRQEAEDSMDPEDSEDDEDEEAGEVDAVRLLHDLTDCVYSTWRILFFSSQESHAIELSLSC